MNIGIIGAGAIGLLLASQLSEKHTITLFTRTEQQAKKIMEKGLTLLEGDSSRTYDVKAYSLTEGRLKLKEMEVFLITVKQTALDEVLQVINGMVTCAVFLQNGISPNALFTNVHIQSIYKGIVEHGAIRKDESSVIHTGRGTIKIGLFSGKNNENMPNLGTPEFPIELHENIHPIIIEKLIVNAMINPLTGILGIKNGELYTNPYYRKGMEVLFYEVCEGLCIEEPNRTHYLNKIHTICQNTAANTSSMLKDLQEGRVTEIDSILGYILAEADKRDVRLPQCQMAYLMIKGMEKRANK